MAEELAIVKAEPRHLAPQIFSPRNLPEAMELAKMIAESDLAPKEYKGKPGNIIIAMQLGSEIGLAPMQSLQSIAVINGRPSVWGDAALALVQNHPAYEWHSEVIAGEEDNRVAVFQIKRRGQEKPHEAKFSVKDAKRANLWNREGPWRNYPDRMLTMRARGFGLRNSFADALKGLSVTEEVNDYPPTVDESVKESLRQSRREIERGTLEVSKEKNRGHGNEALGYGDTGICPKHGDYRPFDFCRTCALPSKENKPEERARPESNKTIPEVEVLETAVVNAQVGTTRLSAKQVEENKMRSAEEKHQGAPYYKITCMGDVLLYVYDQHLFRAVLQAKGKKNCAFVVQKGTKGLLQIKEVVHIEGHKFSRDPVTKDAIPADLLVATEKVINAQPAAPEQPQMALEPPKPTTQTAFAHGANVRTISAEIDTFTDTDSVDGKPLVSKSGKPFVIITVKHLTNDAKYDPHNKFYCHNPVLFPSLKVALGRKITFEYTSSRPDARGTIWQTVESIAPEDITQDTGIY